MTSLSGDLPVLTVLLPVAMQWEQHAPGGCRCVCAFFHQGSGTCLLAAEPGLFVRVVSEEKFSPDSAQKEIGTVVVCGRCYRAVATASP